MPDCSNPIQCQTAKRAECTCACKGANHGVLRKMMESPETKGEGEQKLQELKSQQETLKKQKRKVRRQRRAVERKAGAVGTKE